MRKNLKVVCGTAIAAAMLLAPVLAQAADPQTQSSQATGQSQQTAAPTPADATPSQQTTTPTPAAPAPSQQTTKPGAQDEEPSTPLPAQVCNDRGNMSHGYWTLAPSAEYGGECTLTFMATDPNQENDFKGMETYADIDNDWHSYYSRLATLDSEIYGPAQIDHGARAAKFSQAKHIVFNGTTPDAKTMLPEDARWMFAEWGDHYEINWDTWESVTTNVNLKTFKSNGHLDTSHTKNMKAMFQYDWNMTDLDTTGWDTSHVEDISSMFDEDRAFTSLDLSNWDVSSVKNMYQTFWNMTGLKTLNLSGWDTTNVTNMDGMLSWNGLETLTVGPKTKLSAFKDFEMDHHIDPNAPGDSGWWSQDRAYKGNWVKVTGLSNGTSGTTEALNDSKPQTAEEVNETLTNDPNRAGTYTRMDSQSQTPYLNQKANLNLKANLPAGYTAQASADGYTADAAGNLTASAQVDGVNAMNVAFPTFDAAQQITGNGQKHDITQTSTAMNLPASSPFTLTKSSGTTDTYTFQGWSTTPNATVADYRAGDPVNLTGADTTLYAVWKKDVKESKKPAHHATSASATPGTSTPSHPSSSSPTASSALKPSHAHETNKPTASASDTHHVNDNKDNNKGNVTVQPATSAPSLAAPVATAESPALAPAALNLPSAQTLAAPATAMVALARKAETAPASAKSATPTAPESADQSIGQTPNNIAPQGKLRSCKVAYYVGGSVAPAAVMCSAEGAAMTPIASQASSTAPVWLFMLAFAALSMMGMFIYQHRRKPFIAQHGSTATRRLRWNR
ncbi:BspA family leucine-rich repeat surface protein [Bifidobacterium sp. ESL0728]|uniref:BspA family leucine-rich repeat surface protein n=1 Tax=Bifidobacterium sp. ESL0728 TaxID=2983220 RepID=UPI0023F8FFCA|nr:BspA family leucine-rich repeat surface protein [Bifidobacterium sp. ESL0728]WEV58768.1 BspA family leucine-rich repeat surface protein [Bifidobacterium sp. ESL0728]